MGLIKSLKDALTPDTEETVIRELECEDCGTAFMTETPAEEATCDECGSTALREESKMYAGTHGGGGA